VPVSTTVPVEFKRLVVKTVGSPDGTVVFWTIKWPVFDLFIKVQLTSGLFEVKTTEAVASLVFVQSPDTLSKNQLLVGPTSVIV